MLGTKNTTPPRSLSRVIERTCFVVALVCGLYLLCTFVQGWAARRAASRIVLAAEAKPVGALPVTWQDPEPGAPAAGDGKVIGRLEIPKLQLTVPILSNYDPDSLKRGVGHIPGTAFPGGLGTVGLAGHRDMFLRPLRNIQKGMDVRLAGANGTYHYAVDSTEIVQPSEVRVLDIGDRPELTLITCYPFYYVGSAPLRFIVHAHLISALPD